MSIINIFWFRRDLRLHDNAGLYHALKSGYPILPIFIFDDQILNKLSNRHDARVSFIYKTILELKAQIQLAGSDLEVFYGTPHKIWLDIISKYKINAVYFNHDYESYALKRDSNVKLLLENNSINCFTYKDHVIFEKEEVIKDDGRPYTVFTPYKKKWLANLTKSSPITKSYYLKSYPSAALIHKFLSFNSKNKVPTLLEMGFIKSELSFPSIEINQSVIKSYDQNRDFPSISGTSKLGIHFRFGTISIRQKALKASYLNETYLSELIWRDFYAMILFHFPHIEHSSFRPEYDQIEWRNDENEFSCWCEGNTGYPIVDAGMRELKATGFMHNRVRMITASFLTKHLLIDWRWGEQWFANHLLDFDLASNNGGWQWAAGCGTDAAPYFRIFSPAAQTEKFDKNQTYIKKWVPSYGTDKYPKPIVEHTTARERCLITYKNGLNRGK